ncbi:hypothetical protein [Amycolatopsis sp. CA-230715]|uniref:hypothetical protein n=1 Tax=Amycolatopsis sp. CA-230715 TaxID=2745196 RepID=UPI001C012C2B|nr:hypothetical protein [Amycolatopsis sp. CA-230715]
MIKPMDEVGAAATAWPPHPRDTDQFPANGRLYGAFSEILTGFGSVFFKVIRYLLCSVGQQLNSPVDGCEYG